MRPFDDLVQRFRADWDALAGGGAGPIALAVSGGPDSLALLLLAAAAWPGRAYAATVDHGLRAEGPEEAAAVAAVCASLSVPHRTLAPAWESAPAANIQAAAREARYAALAQWAREEGLEILATGHHCDDQAETLLMRLARGSGLSGLAGVRGRGSRDGLTIIRPLLSWRKAELVALVRAAGIEPAEDPSNSDARFDRSRARALLAREPWLDPARLAAAAAHLAEAEAALAFGTARLWEERACALEGGGIALHPEGLPPELLRRLVHQAFARLPAKGDLRGPNISRLLALLRAGRPATLAGIKVEPGPPWIFRPAPPRRR